MRKLTGATGFRIWLVVVMLVLVAPLAAMIVLSFNESRFGTLPFVFSMKWYEAMVEDTALLGALETSVKLSAQVTVFTILIGTALSFGINKVKPLFGASVNAALLIVLTVPAIIFAAGLIEVFDWIGLGKSDGSLILASIVTSMPFVVLVVTGRLRDFDGRLTEAAASLGAGPVRVFLRVTLPLMLPSIIAGGLLSFVICFNNFVIQLFIAPVGVSTLPVQIYSMVRLGVTPNVNALGAIIVVATIAIIVALQLLTGNAARLFVSRNKD